MPSRVVRGGVVSALLVALFGAGCTLLPWYRVPDDAFSRDTVHVDCCVRGGARLEVTYLGVGGWIFRSGDAVLLTAPLYSNPGLVETGLERIHPEGDVVDRELPPVEDAAAILVGHGHYDHLMDVPWIMEHRAPDALLYANRTSFIQVAPWGFGERKLAVGADGVLRPAPGDGRVVVLGEEVAASNEAEGRWIEVTPGIRVLPLVSDHAPHLAGVTLYSGERRVPMAEKPVSAEQWLDGRTLAYVIDLLAGDGTTAMRIYYQDAVAAPPFGLLPPSLDGTIDLVLVVPATYAEVDWHPEALVEDAAPRHVLLGHWENFFQPPDAEVEPVPFTLLSDFLRRLERALPEDVGYHVPVPGTVFVFR